MVGVTDQANIAHLRQITIEVLCSSRPCTCGYDMFAQDLYIKKVQIQPWNALLDHADRVAPTR